MNEDKKDKTAEASDTTKRSKSFYIKLAIAYGVALLLLLLAVNIEPFETAINRIFSVTAPIFFGAMIAYLCNPIFVFFQNKAFAKIKSIKWRKTLAILLTYIIVFLVLFGIIFMVAEQMIISVQSFMMNIDSYIVNAENFIFGIIDNLGFIKSEAELGGSTNNPPTTQPPVTSPEATSPADTSESTSVETTPTVESTTPVETKPEENKINLLDFSFTKEGIIEAIHNFLNNSGELFNQIGSSIVASGSAAISFVFNIFLGFIFSVYMLVEKDSLIAHTKKLCYAFFKKERADSLCELARYADDKVGHFIKGKLIESGIVGALAYVAFLIFDIPSPLMIAVIVAIMNVIPFFGPFLGAIPAALIVLLIDPLKTIPYVIIVVIIMQINGNYISPKIVGNRTGLTPLGAIAALTLMSGYYGVIGMFLGIPICAILVETLWHQANKRLAAKELATDVNSYYSDDALFEKEAKKKPRNLTSLIVDTTVSLFCKIFRVNKKSGKNNNQDGTSDN